MGLGIKNDHLPFSDNNIGIIRIWLFPYYDSSGYPDKKDEDRSEKYWPNLKGFTREDIASERDGVCAGSDRCCGGIREDIGYEHLLSSLLQKTEEKLFEKGDHLVDVVSSNKNIKVINGTGPEISNVGIPDVIKYLNLW